MTTPTSAVILSSLVPALALFIILQQAATWMRRSLTFRGSAVLLLICVAGLVIPVDGLSLGRRFAGFVPGLSITLTVLLLQSAATYFGAPLLLRPQDQRAIWWFGAVAGLVLFPAALGLGPWDPYTAGWHFSALFVVVGLLGAVSLWRGNRLGWVLLAAIGAWQLGLLESTNYWDYLVDPVFFVLSLVAVVSWLFQKESGVPTAAGPATNQS